MSAWADPDWFRDEREANPPDPYEMERIRLRAAVRVPVSYLRCAACGKRLGDYGDCDSCSFDESEDGR